MRAVAVAPGPEFSVADCHRGWVSGLRANGVEVADFNFNDWLSSWEKALRGSPLDDTPDFAPTVARLASKGVEAACYEMWPDFVLVTSCFFVDPFTLALIRRRGHKIVFLATESPYEDDRQLGVARFADIVLLNDPVNIDRFREVCPRTYYTPHAYDPDLHHPRPPEPDLAADFCFVGTGYQSRVDFLEHVDWAGMDVALAGNWQQLTEDSPLRKFVAHDLKHCLDNTDTVRMYTSAKASANLYRKEVNAHCVSDGLAIGPREVEMAACRLFFLREPRSEGDGLFPMLPTFDGPGDFEEKLRWFLAHDREREKAAEQAQAAVSDRTFTKNAADLLRLLDQ